MANQRAVQVCQGAGGEVRERGSLWGQFDRCEPGIAAVKGSNIERTILKFRRPMVRGLPKNNASVVEPCRIPEQTIQRTLESLIVTSQEVQRDRRPIE
jgi:hypothetical protein